MREDVGHGAEPAQRRGAHRRFRHQVMDDALGREYRRAARRCAWRRRRWIPARRSAAAPAADRAAPAAAADCRRRPAAACASALQISVRPVGRLAGVVEQGVHLHHHRRRYRLEAEFLLAPPAHADRHARPLHRDDGGIGRGVVGAVMAVAARTLHVVHRDRRRHRARASAPTPRAADRRPGNASTPSDGRRESPPARRTARSRHARDAARDRSPRNVLPALRVGRLGAPNDAVDRRPLQQPARFLLDCGRRLDVLPGDMVRRRPRRASTAVSSSPRMARKLPWRTNSIGALAARRIAASSTASMRRAAVAAGARRGHAPCRRAPCRG